MIVLVVVIVAVVVGSRRYAASDHHGTGPPRRVPALVAGGLAIAVAALYLWVIFHQGDPVNVALSAGVATVILVAAALAIAGAVIRRAGMARTSLIASTVLLFIMGVVGLLSIGLPLLGAGVLTFVSAAGRHGQAAGYS